MSLKPYDRKISYLFKDKEYAIDFYQREYKWSNKQEHMPVKFLMDDIFYRFELDYKPNVEANNKNIANYEWYYVSSYMTNEVNGKIYIVDGQQRLTTLTLIVIKLYNLCKAYGIDEDIREYLRGSICGTSLQCKKLWMGFDDRKSALNDIFENDTSFKNDKRINISEVNIYDNYLYIDKILNEKLKNMHKLHTFILYYFERIFLIEIAVEKQKDVAMVFEVINDRGIPLKAYEILKGKLLGQINKNDINKYIALWEKNIYKIENFGEKEIDGFFSFYFRSKYADSSEQYRKLEEDKYHRTIFLDEWNQKIGLKHNEQKVKDFVSNNLEYYVDIYTEVLKYYNNLDNNYEYIYFNRLNDQDGQFLLILSTISTKDAQRNEKIKLVSKLFDRNYTILNLTGSYRSNVFNESIIKLSQKIREKSADEIKIAFDEQLLDDVKRINDRDDIKEPFKYEFFNMLSYNNFARSFLRYYFARIEHFISQNAKLSCSNYYQLVLQGKGENVHHIEHILANNNKNRKLFKDEEEFNIQRNRLGGLVLLKGPDNQSSNDEPYTEKLKTYSGNGTLFAQSLRSDFYKSNTDFIKLMKTAKLGFKPYPKKYDLTSIEERQRLLFDISKLIWKI